MARKTEQSPCGTSFHNVEIYATVNDLLKLFPDSYSDGDGGYKVHHEFTLETEDGEVFTLYDWKEYRKPRKDETVCFHVGGKSFYITSRAAREVERMLQG